MFEVVRIATETSVTATVGDRSDTHYTVTFISDEKACGFVASVFNGPDEARYDAFANGSKLHVISETFA